MNKTLLNDSHAQKDLHEKPFDESDKLEILEDYAQAWIPTFVMSGTDTICIFDFFAGTGYVKEGVEGAIELAYYNEDFEVLFPSLTPLMKRFPSLVYLDQKGIKLLSE